MSEPISFDSQARFLTGEEEVLNKAIKSFAPGFIGFGNTRANDKVLISVDSNVDLSISLAIARALREKGAIVDIIVTDGGPDREIQEADEIKANIRREPWRGAEDSYPERRYLEVPWVTKIVKSRGYDLHIQGRAYPDFVDFRWEGHPWQQAEHFLSEANQFPRELHELINRKAWDPIWHRGKGAKVHLTDPEGTDLTYTLLPEYWDNGADNWFEEEPAIGHLMYHPGPPISPGQDASGIVAGTVAHFAKPFPRLTATVDNGFVTKVEGGGAYGDGWRDLMDETREVHYPQFPRPGLFWLWEVAVGTNPKVRRTSSIKNVAGGGTEWERWRAGVIHMGFGTAGPSDCEQWAGEHGYPYGHLHLHLFFPTVKITRDDGTVEIPIQNGRLAALDDPEVRECAAKYGDPDELLREEWIPEIPGVNGVNGCYDVYAADPSRWFE